MFIIFDLWNVQLIWFYPLCNFFAIGVVAVFQGIGLASCKSGIGYIFTSDEWVSEQHSHIYCSCTEKRIYLMYSMLSLYYLQHHRGNCLGEPHSLHICTVFWCNSGMSERNTSCFTISHCVEHTELYPPFILICLCFQCVCSGILIGSGMQKIAALSNLVCYYGVGLPVGALLMFKAELRILGNSLNSLFLCVILHVIKNRYDTPVISLGKVNQIRSYHAFCDFCYLFKIKMLVKCPKVEVIAYKNTPSK